MRYVVALVAVVLAGCTPIRSEREVTGIYELTAKKQKIVLNLYPNHTFDETIQFRSGQVHKQAGRWRWAYGRVNFDSLWVPSSFVPDYIHQADAEAGPRRFKYTEPGNWSVAAERHWGTNVLSVFPDDDINFRKVRRASR